MPHPTPTPTISRNISCAVLIGCALVASSAWGAGVVVHVPADTPSIQQALDTVPDGGIIEIAAGTYASPTGGFTVFPGLDGSTRSFTVRAASGATVILSGNGTNRILTFTTPRPITFERLTFANGLSTEQYQGGAISVAFAQANFVSCKFENNVGKAPTTGGGAVWIDRSTVSFQGCTFTNNTSLHYAGALSAAQSRVYIRDSRFSGNRVNLPGHSHFNAGGAIHGNATTMHVANSSFDNNEAAYVGGAIYVISFWEDTPTDLLVTDSVFTNNSALKDAGASNPDPTTGGAVFLEANAKGRFYNCRFTNNSSSQGGALSSYQTITEVQNCVFTNNRAVDSAVPESFGGAIFAISADNPNPSLGQNQPNRRPAELTVTDTLIQGGGPGSPSARQGGGIFLSGDLNFAFGLSRMPQKGSIDSNRGVANLTRVVFSNLHTVGPNNNGGTGAAMTGDFAKVNVQESMVLNCSTSHNGSAFHFGRQSVINIDETTFSGNSAGSFGAVTMFGSTLNIKASNFLDNRLTGSDPAGSAIVTAPDQGGSGLPPIDMTGTISDCLFSNNTGPSMIYDGDSLLAPFNRLQYSANRIFPNDATVFLSDLFPAPQSVAQMNVFVIIRVDGTTTDKTPIDNIALNAAPSAAAILMVPPTILQGGAPGEAVPIPSFLAYAGSGGDANIDGASQADKAGVATTLTDAVHTLTVNSATASTVPLPGTALNISTRLLVGNGQNVLIGGFIIQGSAPKRVMVRTVGPSLSPGVPDALQDPTLELRNGAGALLAQNDNWRTTQVGGLITSQQSIDLIATTIPPANDAEAAIVTTLEPGAYTAIVGGANNSTGIALVEVYDLDAVPNSKLANISTRGFVQIGDNVMIGGFIYLGGTGATNVALRGIGPSLVAAGINNALSDPVLAVYDSNGRLVDANDNWQQSLQAGALQAVGLAPGNNAESALLLTGLARGAYTAILRGANDVTGVGVVEVYVFSN